VQIEGTVLRGPELEPVAGRVVVEGDRITAVEETGDAGADRIVAPAFVNAHTHIGDSIVKEAGAGLDLDELVAPPDGLKHRRLREADRETLVDGMRRTVRFMRRTGTAACCDFREGGPAGVRALRDAAAGLDVEALAFGRGDAAVLDVADGYGASGAADADFETQREAARDRGAPFGIHAGEGDANDIEPALALDPDFLVHMVHATDAHLDRAGASGTPIVVCPRANLVTGVGLPPVERIAERTTLALGTDNVMFNAPSPFRELELLTKLFDIPAREALRAATVNAADVAGLDVGVVEPGRPAKLLVLDAGSDNLHGHRDVHRAVARRAGIDDVERVVLR
jgi:cytosine/adenosine deaminase-related metal-dependent hydrolase